MKKTQPLISIVIPVYNEALGIPELVKQLLAFMNARPKFAFEVIFVEHGSKDDSFKLLRAAALKEKRLKVLQLAKNVGVDGGICAGLKYASGDAAVILMADLQEPIELIDSFFVKWKEGYQIVYGLVRKRTAGWHRDLAARIYYKVLNLLLENRFPENVSDFRLMDRKVYQVINQMTERNMYLRGLISWTGFSHIGVPFDRHERFAGESKHNYLSFMKVAANGIFSFSYKPLRFVSALGVIMTSLTIMLSIAYLVEFVIRGRVYPGMTTIFLLILGLFGVHFFVLGIISEYILRIYDEAKSRPTYIVNQTVGLSLRQPDLYERG